MIRASLPWLSRLQLLLLKLNVWMIHSAGGTAVPCCRLNPIFALLVEYTLSSSICKVQRHRRNKPNVINFNTSNTSLLMYPYLIETGFRDEAAARSLGKVLGHSLPFGKSIADDCLKIMEGSRGCIYYLVHLADTFLLRSRYVGRAFCSTNKARRLIFPMNLYPVHYNCWIDVSDSGRNLPDLDRAQSFYCSSSTTRRIPQRMFAL